jgi:hypothetical protein
LQLAWGWRLACLGAFVVLSQSRGAALALVATVMMAPLWFRTATAPCSHCWRSLPLAWPST